MCFALHLLLKNVCSAWKNRNMADVVEKSASIEGFKCPKKALLPF